MREQTSVDDEWIVPDSVLAVVEVEGAGQTERAVGRTFEEQRSDGILERSLSQLGHRSYVNDTAPQTRLRGQRLGYLMREHAQPLWLWQESMGTNEDVW